MIKAIKENRNEILVFGLYMFCFLLIEQIINDNIGIKLNSDFVLFVYAVSIFFTGLGYLSLSFFNKIKLKEKLINLIIKILFVVSWILIFILNGYLCILFSILTTFSFGYIGAYVHWKISQSLVNSKVVGKTIGISISCALVLQILFYNIIKNNSFLMCSIILFVVIILFKKINDIRVNDNIKGEFKKINKVIPIIMVAVISIIVGLQDAIITSMDSLKDINVYGIPRLFYVFGVLVAGLVADIDDGKYLGISTIIGVLIAICGIPLLKLDVFYIANSCLIFLLSGFYVMHLTVKFIQIAPYTKNSMLWAGMGRVVRSLVTGIVVLPADFVFKNYGSDFLIITSIMCSIILIITLYKELAMTMFVKREINLEKFMSNFNFTPREKEVCQLILKENKKTKEISKILYMSERSVQRHLTKIYQKTNTTSRNELYNLFYNI